MLENKPPAPTKKIAKKFSEGNKVFHEKFGVGLIKLRLGRDVFRVAFEDHGTVDIHCDYLSLISSL